MKYCAGSALPSERLQNLKGCKSRNACNNCNNCRVKCNWILIYIYIYNIYHNGLEKEQRATEERRENRGRERENRGRGTERKENIFWIRQKSEKIENQKSLEKSYFENLYKSAYKRKILFIYSILQVYFLYFYRLKAL